MFEATLERLQTGQKDRCMYKIPPNLQESFWAEIKKSPQYNRVRIGKPSKPRTTGDLSQNHKIYQCLNILSDFTGYEVAELKMMAKYRAIKRGYPYRWIKIWNPEQKNEVDQIEPKHEYELSTIECGLLIDELESMCSEAGIST